MVSISDYEPILPRARLGFIIPASNRMVEPQVQHFCPDGVIPHFARAGITNRHAAPLAELKERIAYQAELLGDSKVDVVVLQCTGTSMGDGPQAEEEVVTAMAEASGTKALSTARCVTSALNALGVRDLVFVSESKQAGHAKKERYLEGEGFNLVRSQGMALPGSDSSCTTPSEFWLDTLTEMKDPKAEAYFISCANVHATYKIPELEKVLEAPVLTSNQAALWCALRTAGIKDDVPGLGSLFKFQLSVTRPAAAE
ncbi:MAG: hypothetical protein VW226_03995 [Rhodospirillaceae bacterium]|jgi:maleate isomerase